MPAVNEFDPYIAQENADRGAQVIQIDSSKHVTMVAVCAIVCGLCAAISFTCWRAAHDDLVDVQDQYQKERNHVIELEARQKVLADELEELKHHVR